MSTLRASFCFHAPDASGMLGLYAVKESPVPIDWYFQSVESGFDRCSQQPVRLEAAYSSSRGTQIVFAESAEALCTERGPQFGALCQVVLLNRYQCSRLALSIGTQAYLKLGTRHDLEADSARQF